MLADLILVGVTLLVLLIASIFDLKTREIPDTLSYGLIVVALSIRLINGVTAHAFSYFLYGLIGLGVAFIFGYVLYHLKQMGGGDAKLLMGFGRKLWVYVYRRAGTSNTFYWWSLLLPVGICNFCSTSRESMAIVPKRDKKISQIA